MPRLETSIFDEDRSWIAAQILKQVALNRSDE